MKQSYLAMVAEAIFHLQERKGSSAQAIWKYVQTRFPESVRDQKLFRVQLSRIAQAGGKHVEKSTPGRFKLNRDFRRKVLRAMAQTGSKAMPVMQAAHAMTTKVKNDRKAKAKLRLADKRKRAGARKALSRQKKAAKSKARATKKRERAAAKKAATKAAKGKKAKSTKAKKAAKKAKAPKGSAASKKKKAAKSKKAASKVKANKKAN